MKKTFPADGVIRIELDSALRIPRFHAVSVLVTGPAGRDMRIH